MLQSGQSSSSCPRDVSLKFGRSLLPLFDNPCFLKALSKVSRLFRSDALRDAILSANTPGEIYALIAQEDGKA